MGTNIISQDPNNLICDAIRCYAEAAIRISVRLRSNEVRSLNICENCKKKFFSSCRNENSGSKEALLIDDRDVPLDFDTKIMCTCCYCSNEADIFLGIVRLPLSGYYCKSCANDMKLHGIAEEVITDG